MATEITISSLSPPSHLASIDWWSNLKDRAAVTASLVEGVYSLAVHNESKAKKIWWEPFHFTLREKLISDCDNSVYAVILEYNNYNCQHISGDQTPPRYVIAFRGTILKPHTWICDVKSNLSCILKALRDSTTVTQAVQAAENLVVEQNNTSVWLAGHSLGAARALVVGKTMAKKGFSLETYIFNPPISAFPLEHVIKCDFLKDQIRVSKCLFKTGVASIFKNLRGQGDDPSVNLAAGWIPYLYVNPSDPICSEYIGYFKNKNFMSEIGLSNVEKIATENPIKSLFYKVGGTSSSSDFPAEPLHLLRSAYMVVNTTESQDLGEAHGLHQWWHPSCEGEGVLYPSSSS